MPDLEPLFELKENLYKETCPAVLQSGVLVQIPAAAPETQAEAPQPAPPQEPRSAVRLTFRNIDSRAITALFIDLHVFDKVNTEIEVIRDRRYLVPVAGRDETFGGEEEIQANLKEIAEYKSPWTVGKLLTNKQVWLTSLAYGVYILVTVALISQLIPRLTAGGWTQEKATGMMTVAAVLGLLGSYVTGWMDQKIGTKKTSVIYGIWYLAAVLSCCLPASDLSMYLSVFLIGVGIGGIGNLFPSMVGNLFNRHDFARALGVMNVITLILRSFAFSILAFGLEHLGGFSGAYAIVAGINVVGIICCCLIKDRPVMPEK